MDSYNGSGWGRATNHHNFFRTPVGKLRRDLDPSSLNLDGASGGVFRV
ncbi:MAG: hypothetical protein ACRD5M_08870 [Candidatus Acidiferrales bacterium]